MIHINTNSGLLVSNRTSHRHRNKRRLERGSDLERNIPDIRLLTSNLKCHNSNSTL